MKHFFSQFLIISIVSVFCLLALKQEVNAACSGSVTCYQSRNMNCDGVLPPHDCSRCTCTYGDAYSDSCGDWNGNGGCVEPPFGFCYKETGSCSTGGGGGGSSTPAPTTPGSTPGPVTGECSTGNKCDTTWAGTCCDSGCAHTWIDGYNACAGGGGGGGGSDPEPEPYSCTEKTVCGDGSRCDPGKKCVPDGDGLGGYHCEIKPLCVRCNVTISPDPMQITLGSISVITAEMTKRIPSDVKIVDWNFNVRDNNILRLSNKDKNSRFFTADARGMSLGSTRAGIEIDLGYRSCNDSITVNVIQAGPWWQVVGGDVTTDGSVSSKIPTSCTAPNCNPVLITNGAGGYPGVVSHGSGYDFSAGADLGNPSTPGWIANSGYSTQSYNYSFFENLIPKNTVFNSLSGSSVPSSALSSGGTATDGFYWYKHTGDLTINGALTMPSGRKVVLFVDGGNLTFDGNVIMNTPGDSLLFAVVGKTDSETRGNISLSTTTSRLEGVYLSEGSFQSGASNQQLNIKGSIASLGGFLLQRDLGPNNSNTPAHIFTFEPSFMLIFPKALAQYDLKWQEVAP